VTIVLLACICLIAVVVQDAFPGLAWYHTGSYALLLFVLCALLAWRLQKLLRVSSARDRPLSLVTAGALIVGAAGLASGLLGPDTQTYVSAPGANVAISEPAGMLQFPIDPTALQRPVAVRFEGAGGHAIAVPAKARRYFGGFVMWSVAREVAVVSAEDLRGRRLTITQPSNPSFLSPVLLFVQRSQIGGRTLPVDSFSIPAMQRTVKAVLFSGPVLAQMRDARAHLPAVLVAVEDDRGHLLPGAIRLIPTHAHAAVGGVIIGDTILGYPQIVVAAAPYLPLLVLGIAVLVAGLIWRIAFQKFVPLVNRKRSILTAGTTVE